MKTFAAITLGAVLVLAGAAGALRAEGPVNDRGKLDFLREEWLNADVGNNPLNAREAAATLALVGACIRVGEIDLARLYQSALVRDVLAGGTTPADYKAGGPHRALFTWYQAAVLSHRGNADSLLKLIICSSPYVGL